MIVVFPWQRLVKPSHEFLDTTQTFPGDMWLEAEAMLQVEQTWELLADADAVVQSELSQVSLLDGLQPSPQWITVVCLGGEVVKGTVIEAGSDFAALMNGDHHEIAIHLKSIVRVSGMPTRVALGKPTKSPSDVRSLRMWLRECVGHEIECTTIENWKLRGQILHVGQDFVQVADREDEICNVAMQAIATIRK